MAVPGPILDKGGRSQAAFGQQGGSMAFTPGIKNTQSEPSLRTNPSFTSRFHFVPVAQSYLRHYRRGMPLFIDKTPEKNINKLYDWNTLMFLMRQSRENEKIRAKNQAAAAASGSKGLTTGLQLDRLKNPHDTSFLTRLESFIEHIEFCGVGDGSAAPARQVGGLRSNEYARNSQNAVMVMPTVTKGHAVFPNVFSCDLIAGQEIFLYVKPVHHTKGPPLVNPIGEKLDKSHLDGDDMVLNAFWYVGHKPPQSMSDLSCLVNVGDQPPWYDVSYYDPDDEQYKDAIVWSIGKVLHNYNAPAGSQGMAGGAITGEILARSQIEIMVNIRRVYY